MNRLIVEYFCFSREISVYAFFLQNMCVADFCLYFFYNLTSGSNYKETSYIKLKQEMVRIVSRTKLLYHYLATNE